MIPHLDMVIEMISKNLFRPLGALRTCGKAEAGMEEDEQL